MNKKKEFIERLAALQAQEPELKKSRLDLIDQQGLGTKAEASDADASHNKPFVYNNINSEHTGVERGVAAPKDVKQHFENGDSKKKNITGNDCTAVTDLGLKLDSLVDLYFLNKSIFNLGTQSVLHDKFSTIKDSSYTDATSGVKLSGHPFRHCVLPDFISNDTFINNLESVLQEIPLRTKNNDLYKFLQSGDLTCSKNLTISKFRSLCENLKSFISHVTGIPLNNKMDLFCSQYKYTDILLCHDDELEERRIAFIYYLVPNSWSASDGGTLDLFDSDEKKIQPKNVVKSIVPTRNSFLFFEVSEISFHQVAEVLSETKTRLSLSGWFHGPPLARQPQPLVDTLPPAVPFGSIEEEVFYAWFNPLYLAPEVQTDVRSRFEADSEIELTDFLQEDKYQALMAALQENSINWELTGPANKRHYYRASKDDLPAVVSEFLRVMHSDAAFLVLSNLTGLKLHPLAPSDDDEPSGSSGECSTSERVVPCQSKISCPRCRSEVRKWQHGCYTLAHDTDAEIMDFALDVIMYVGSEKDWNFDNGGYTSYIAKGEDEELLSICPSGNSLALVYRDKDTMRFVKHLNHHVTKLPTSCFYEINTVYYE